LRSAPPGVLCVSLADKLHNGRSILRDLEDIGPALWDRFNVGVDSQLWCYQELAAIFVARLPGPFTEEFSEVVTRITRLAGAQG